MTGVASRRGNPFDNAKAESSIKTLKVEAIYLQDYETFEDVATDPPRFLEVAYNTRRLHSARGYRNSVHMPCQDCGLTLSTSRGAVQRPCTFLRHLHTTWHAC